jgi:hypothetical protein
MNKQKGGKRPLDWIESDGTDLFVIYRGDRIAMRGRPNTPQAKTWISIRPSFQVLTAHDRGGFVIRKDGVVIRQVVL